MSLERTGKGSVSKEEREWFGWDVEVFILFESGVGENVLCNEVAVREAENVICLLGKLNYRMRNQNQYCVEVFTT